MRDDDPFERIAHDLCLAVALAALAVTIYWVLTGVAC